MSYRDGKRDPKGFILFQVLENLPHYILPRDRGNRLHVLFHIGGTPHQYHSKFNDNLQRGSLCENKFSSVTGYIEIPALGLIGKLVTGP